MKKVLLGAATRFLTGSNFAGRRWFPRIRSRRRRTSWRSFPRCAGTAGLNARFIKVESEHSAMACILGAASAGARVFTATSSHGLALMHEVLHWAAGSRLPIVLANVNRAIGPPWSIMPDQGDSLAQRDTGWIQLFTESGQEAMDTIIQAYKIAEQVLLPVMVNLDGFFLSHTSEVVNLPEQDAVDAFLPPFDPPFKLDTDDPRTFGGPLRGRSLRGVSIRHAKGHGQGS